MNRDQILSRASRTCFRFHPTDDAKYCFDDATMLQFARAIVDDMNSQFLLMIDERIEAQREIVTTIRKGLSDMKAEVRE